MPRTLKDPLGLGIDTRPLAEQGRICEKCQGKAVKICPQCTGYFCAGCKENHTCKSVWK